MPIRNAIRPATTPAADDLEGWKARVEYLENELTLALDQVDHLEPDLGLPEVSEDDDNASA